MRALYWKGSDVHAEVKQKPARVAEQRVSNFGIHLLIGLSLVLTKVLQLLPMAVLYGVFLFMGVGSLPTPYTVQGPGQL